MAVKTILQAKHLTQGYRQLRRNCLDLYCSKISGAVENFDHKVKSVDIYLSRGYLTTQSHCIFFLLPAWLQKRKHFQNGNQYSLHSASQTNLRAETEYRSCSAQISISSLMPSILMFVGFFYSKLLTVYQTFVWQETIGFSLYNK